MTDGPTRAAGHERGSDPPVGRRRRGPARVHGVFALDKPAGITSFAAVREVRRIVGETRVGHAGTLDPMATGILPICVGHATRLVDYLHQQPKRYLCTVRLGERSDTMDLEGDVTAVADAGGITVYAVQLVLRRFVGTVLQIPPMHSAVRHEGRHLYELARQGVEVERKPREVHVARIDVTRFVSGPVAVVDIDVVCGKGTYMRVLAHDLGEALGVGGLLASLQRSEYGPLTLERSVGLEDLRALEDPSSALLSPDVAVAHLPRVDLVPQLATQLRRGQSVWLPRGGQIEGTVRAHDAAGELIAVGEVAGGLLRPTKVLVGGSP